MTRNKITQTTWTTTPTTSERTVVSIETQKITDERRKSKIIHSPRHPVSPSLSAAERSVDVSAPQAWCIAAHLCCFLPWLPAHSVEIIVVFSTTANLILWGGSFIATLVGYLREYFVYLHILSCLGSDYRALRFCCCSQM